MEGVDFDTFVTKFCLKAKAAGTFVNVGPFGKCIEESSTIQVAELLEERRREQERDFAAILRHEPKELLYALVRCGVSPEEIYLFPLLTFSALFRLQEFFFVAIEPFLFVPFCGYILFPDKKVWQLKLCLQKKTG